MSPTPFIDVHWQTWLWSAALLGGAALLVVTLNRVIFALANRIVKRSPSSVVGALVRYGENPAQLILVLITLLALLPVLPLTPAVAHGVQHALGLGLIACVGWMLIALVQVFEATVAVRHSGDLRANVAARRIRTQVQMLRRIAASVIVVVTIAIMLMTFPAIRTSAKACSPPPVWRPYCRLRGAQYVEQPRRWNSDCSDPAYPPG